VIQQSFDLFFVSRKQASPLLPLLLLTVAAALDDRFDFFPGSERRFLVALLCYGDSRTNACQLLDHPSKQVAAAQRERTCD